MRILVSILILSLFSCDYFKSSKTSKLSQDWEMIDMYEDQIDEINEGGYYALFLNQKREVSDSIPPDEEINDNIVAIAVKNELKKGKSNAMIWVADSKQNLILQSDETVDKKSYKRIYTNDDFEVSLDMKFSEKIDGLDEEDMLIYRGKMTISQNGTGIMKEYKVKGGI